MLSYRSTTYGQAVDRHYGLFLGQWCIFLEQQSFIDMKGEKENQTYSMYVWMYIFKFHICLLNLCYRIYNKFFGNENLYCKQSRFYITGELYTFPTTSLLHPVENLFYSFKWLSLILLTLIKPTFLKIDFKNSLGFREMSTW